MPLISLNSAPGNRCFETSIKQSRNSGCSSGARAQFESASCTSTVLVVVSGPSVFFKSMRTVVKCKSPALSHRTLENGARVCSLTNFETNFGSPAST